MQTGVSCSSSICNIEFMDYIFLAKYKFNLEL
jgi:hypothetical protein